MNQSCYIDSNPVCPFYMFDIRDDCIIDCCDKDILEIPLMIFSSLEAMNIYKHKYCNSFSGHCKCKKYQELIGQIKK